jgi:tRNA pseudouridine38-40 synthase
MIACSRHLRLTFLRVRIPQHYLPKRFSSTMSGSPDLQPQKRILLAEDSETLSKKPRLVEEPTQADSSSLPQSLEASPRDSTITGVPAVDMRMAVDGEENDQMQTDKVKSSELQSKGKKKKIRPPRVGGRRSRNEEDEERRKGSLVLPTGEMEPPKALRLPKRQCALLLGFCGSGYRGMQM